MKTSTVDEKSYRCFESALGKNDLEMARLYLLNAITHQAKTNYLSAYVDLIARLSSEERDEATDQALNILSMAALNCDPDDLPEIQRLIAKLSAAADGSADDPPPRVVDVAQVLDRSLKPYAWDRLRDDGKIDNPDVIAQRLDILKDALESDALSGRQLESASADLQDTKTFLDYLTVMASVRGYLEECEAELALKGWHKDVVFARLQQAANLLGQLWLYDVSFAIPRMQYRKEVGILQDRYRSLEGSFLRQSSQPLVVELRERISQADHDARQQNGAVSFTCMLDRIQEVACDVTRRLPDIQDRESVQSLQQALAALGKTAQDVGRKRHAAYQKWCSDLATKAVKKYEDITLRVSEGDALKILRICEFSHVDESLLAPETASIYQMAKQMLEAKLSVLKKVEFEASCATCDGKKRLEDF